MRVTEREQLRADIKKRLKNYRDISAELREIQEKLVELGAAPSSPNIDGQPRGSGTSDPVGRLACKRIKLQSVYRKRLEKLLDAQADIEQLIADLDPIECRLARFRYIDGLPWEEVCIKINYCLSQTHRLHGIMLEKLVTAEIERRYNNQ